MTKGSLVETVGDFEQIRMEWGLPYPHKGDILTVEAVTPHPVKSCSSRGVVLLHFEELPDLVGICDKSFEGEPNFIELQPPISIPELLKEPISELV